MMKLVFLLEELSMKRALEGILPRVLLSGIRWVLVPHEGKTDLERSIPRKLRGWKEPGVHFIVVRDQDAGDCEQVKQRLLDLCAEAGRPDTLVRIACRELESWFLGDLLAVGEEFGVALQNEARKAKFRNTDTLGQPYQELKRLVPRYQKVSGAERLGARISLGEDNASQSLRAFVQGVRRMDEQCSASHPETPS